MGFLGDLLSPVLGGITSLMGINAQENMNRDNQAFQSQENQKNREWQSAEWQRQFDLTNAYNDPSALVERLKKASLNPSTLLSGSAGAQVGRSSALPSAPSGGTSAIPSPDYSGVITSGFQSMQQIANSIKMLTEAKKTAKETPYIGALLDSQIKENLARFENEQAKADFQKLQNQIEGALGFEIRSKELAKLVSETLLADQDAKLKGAQIELIDVEKLEKSMNALVSYCEANKKQAEADRIRAILEPEIALLRSQSNQANAAAQHSRSMALTEDALREYRVAIEKAESEIKGNESTISAKTWKDTVEAVREAAKAAGLENDKRVKDLIKAGFEINHMVSSEVRKWIKTIQGFLPMSPPVPEP